MRAYVGLGVVELVGRIVVLLGRDVCYCTGPCGLYFGVGRDMAGFGLVDREQGIIRQWTSLDVSAADSLRTTLIVEDSPSSGGGLICC